jgi:fructoselysine 6-kinase
MRLVGVGDNVVDCYPQFGQMFPGGNALNVAVQVARAGVSAAYLGAVGDDAAGAHIRAALAAEGVATDRLRVLPGPSAHAIVRLIDGDRVFESSNKGVSVFSLTDDDLDYLSDFDLAHCGYAARLEAQVPAIAAATRLSFDFATRRNQDYAEPLLVHVHVAEFSGGDLSDTEVEQLARWALGRGPRYVLVTKGQRGAALYSADGVYQQATVSSIPVDTLGAGDAFIGRLLAGLLRAEPLPVTMESAARVAAEAVQIRGAFGYPHRLPDSFSDGAHGLNSRRGPGRAKVEREGPASWVPT